MPDSYRPKRRKVARGEINTLQQRLDLFAFCTTMTLEGDGPHVDSRFRPSSTKPRPMGRCIVDLECFDQSWFWRVWRQDLLPFGGAEVAAIVAKGDFDELFFRLDPGSLTRLFQLHLRFTERCIDPEDPSPGSLVQVMITPGEGFFDILKEGYWYGLTLDPVATPHDIFNDPGYGSENREEMQAVYSQLGYFFEDDLPPERRRILKFYRLPPEIDGLLKALHLPQWDPALPPGTSAKPIPTSPPALQPLDDDLDVPGRGDPIPQSDDETELDVGGDSTPGETVERSALSRALERVRGFAEEWFWPSLLPELSAVGGVPIQGSMPARFLSPEPIRYHARPLVPGVMPAVQVADAMNQMIGPHQAFVGILNIGQGNLNALYGDNGEVVAYYDFGWPKPTEGASAPPMRYAPCLHDDPLLLLSHWDWDHYSMARRLRTSWDLRWIAPQQHVSNPALQIYGRVIASATGEMHIWPAAAAGQHLRLPWGFLERGTGPAPIGAGGTNDSGLVLYVCVRSAGVGAALGAGAVAAAAPLVPRVPAAVPPPAVAKPRATAAGAAAVNVHLHDQVLAISEAVIQVGTQLGAAAAIPWVTFAAALAAGRLTATQLPAATGWAEALMAMANVGGGMAGNPICAQAAALAPVIIVGWPPAHATAAAAVLANAAGVFVLPAAAVGTLEAAAAIADAAAALVPLPGAPPPWSPLLLAAAGPAAHAVANTRAGAMIALAPLAPPPPAVLAQVATYRFDASVNAVAQAAAGAAAEAYIAMGAVGLVPSAVAVARASALVVARASTLGTWWQVLASLALAGLNGPGAILQAAIGLNFVIVAGAPATAAAGVAANAVAAAALAAPAGLHHRSVLAATVALVDGAISARVSTLAVAAAGVGLVGAAVPPAAAGAAVGGSPAQAAALGQQLQQREITAVAREAARQFVLAMGGVMLPIAAPLPPAPGGMGMLPGVPAGPGGAGALAPAAPAIGLAGIIAGPAPIVAAERYVLLTGDVAFEYIPSQGQAPPLPVVVGLTATHHGADTCFPSTSATSKIPYAAGTPSAAAAAAAFASRALGAATRIQTMSAAAGFWGAHVAIRAGLEPLTASITFNDIAVAAGLAHGAGAAGWAGALGAIAGGAAARRDLNGIAAALGALAGVAATCGGAIAGIAGRTAAALATAVAVERVLPVALANAVVITAANVGAGAVAAAPGGAAGVAALGGGVGGVAASMPGAVAGVINAIFAAAGVGGAAAGYTAAATAVPLAPADWHRAVIRTAIVAALADARAAVVAAGIAPFAAASAPGSRPAANAVIADALALGFLAAGPAAVAEKIIWPGTAPPFLGIDGRFTRVGTSSTEASVDAHSAGFAADAARAGAAATAAAAAIRSEQFAISYGVHAATFQHYFGGLNFRHPTPIAVIEYAARGWTQRRNPSVDAWQGAQPDPWALGVAAAFASGDNIAMGWEYGGAYEGPLRGDGGAGGLINRTCPLCGVTHFVCC